MVVVVVEEKGKEEEVVKEEEKVVVTKEEEGICIHTSADSVSGGLGHQRGHQSMHTVLIEVVEKNGFLHRLLRVR